jgi:MFS family permease
MPSESGLQLPVSPAPLAQALPAAADGSQAVTVTTEAQRRRAFAVLFVSIMCLGMGQTVMFAVFPQIAREMLGLSEMQTSLIFSLSAFIWVFTSPYWGRRSDVIGRRPVILIGMGGFSVSIFLFALACASGIAQWLPIAIVYWLLIGARTIYGALGPGAHAASQAYVVDRTSREKRTQALANLSAAFGTGTILGPGIGAMLVVFGLLAPYYFLAIVALGCAVAAWFVLPERTPPREHRPPPAVSPFDRRIVVFMGFGVVAAAVQAIPTLMISFYMSDTLHLAPANAVQFVGIGLMVSACASLFAQLVLIHHFRLSAGVLIRWGLILALASCVLIAASRQYGPLVGALVLNGLGFGMCRPGISAAASLAVGRGEQGGVAGVMVGTGGLGFVVSAALASPLYAVAPQAPFILGAVLTAVLIALNFLLLDFKRDLSNFPEDPDTDVGVGRG